MKQNWWKNLLQFLAGIALAAFLLWFTYRDRELGDLVASMRAIDPFWTAAGALCLLMVHISRALRWQLLLESAGEHPSPFHTTMSVFLLYFVNSLTPKLGEIARCTVLYKTDGVPLSRSLGTVVSERAIDVLVLAGGIGIIFLLEIGRMTELFSQLDGSTAFWTIMVLIGLLLAAVVGFLILRRNADHNLLGKVYAFVRNMLEAAASVFRLEKPLRFFLYTAWIWGSLVLMNYAYIKALPSTAELGWYMAILILFIGGIGWVFPVPAGMGSTHYIISGLLFPAFGLTEAAGEEIGLLSNGGTFVFAILYGLFALAWLAYWWIKVRPARISEKR